MYVTYTLYARVNRLHEERALDVSRKILPTSSPAKLENPECFDLVSHLLCGDQLLRLVYSVSAPRAAVLELGGGLAQRREEVNPGKV